MRDCRKGRAPARLVSAAGPAALLAIVASMSAAQAQTSWIPAGDAPAATSKKAQSATTAAPPNAGAPEDLPWLATTQPAATSPPNAATDRPPGQPASETPPAKPAGAKKTANVTPKCEEQAEDACRGIKSCAWVAAIPQPDGNLTPARCAERKAFAPEKEKKKPAVAAKPKPKPDSAAQVNSEAAPENSAPKSETAAARPEAKPDPKATTAAIPAPPKAEPAPTSPSTPAKPEPAKPETAAAPSEPPQDPAGTEPAKAQVPAMMPRPPVPFLPAEQPSATAPAAQPHSDAAPATANKVASDESAPDQQPPTIPGLIIAE